MSSPFPGMNPYLENPAVWHDFHGVFVTSMRVDLGQQLRGRYQVRMDENIYVHELNAEDRRLLGRADAHVVAPSTEVAGASLGVALVAPVQGTLPISVEVLRERFIEIRDSRDQHVVTVVELLSPTNKRLGPDREQYLSKRRKYLRSHVNLVEIDLLRGGERMPIDGLPDCPYCVLVSPGATRPSVGLWPSCPRFRFRLLETTIRPDWIYKLCFSTLSMTPVTETNSILVLQFPRCRTRSHCGRKS